MLEMEFHGGYVRRLRSDNPLVKKIHKIDLGARVWLFEPEHGGNDLCQLLWYLGFALAGDDCQRFFVALPTTESKSKRNLIEKTIREYLEEE